MADLALHLVAHLRGFSLDAELTVAAGETLAVVGPSGAGKTTLLRCVAGLRRPDAGRVTVGADTWFGDGIDLPPERRAVGYVPQGLALFPHLTVLENVAFGNGARAAELLERLRIADLAGVRPGTLSGGERQRVALARALARRPRVLLLDESLGALDAHTRRTVRAELRDVLAELDVPTLLVTHDFADAARLAHRVAVLDRGRIRQAGTPQALRADPQDDFVAAFTRPEE